MLFTILIHGYEKSELRIKIIDVFRYNIKNESYVTLY